MPVTSADSVQVSIVEEVTPGVTPATPVFEMIRTTGEGVTFTPNTSDDTELTGSNGRCQRPAIVTGQTVAGDISFDLHKAPWMDMVIKGVLAAEWGECPLTGLAGGAVEDADDITVGNLMPTFTIEKKIPDPITPGDFQYQWYRGCSFSSLNLDITPNEVVTGTVSVVGGVPELGSTAIAGSTYISAGNGAKFTAPKVTELTVGSEFAVGTHCFTSASLTLDSQNRGIPCIGSEGDREVVAGRMSASMSGEVYFNDQDILQAMLDDTTVGDTTVILTNSDGDTYRFDLFSVKVVSGQLVASGTGTDLTIPFEVQPQGVKVCDDGSGNDWYSCLMVSKAADAPALPAQVFTDDYTDAALLAPTV